MNDLSRLFFFLGDLVLLNLSIWFATHVDSEPNRVNLIYLMVYSSLAWVFLVLVARPYSITKNWTIEKIFKNQFFFFVVHFLVVVGLGLFLRKNYPPIQIFLLYLIFIIAFVVFRLLALYARRLTTGSVTRYFLIIGSYTHARGLRRHFLLHPEEQMRFAGRIDLSSSFMGEVKRLCEERDIHQIFCCAPGASTDQLKTLVDFGLNSMISVKIVVNSDTPVRPNQIWLDARDRFVPSDVHALALDEPANRLVKRFFDLLLAIVFMSLILIWLIPVMAFLIKIDSAGPVFFLQKRNGRNNRPFDCIKFRTMAFEKNAEFKQAIKDDQRITRMGKFLRKSSIDEFPQFINVIRGDMSLIGPRPHPIKLNEQFVPLIQNLMARHYVKPGITGLAQCMGYRGETKNLADMANRVRLDRYYIENWSFWLDLKIIVLTVISLIRGSEKAY